MNWQNIQTNTIADYISDADFKVSDFYPTDFLNVMVYVKKICRVFPKLINRYISISPI